MEGEKRQMLNNAILQTEQMMENHHMETNLWEDFKKLNATLKEIQEEDLQADKGGDNFFEYFNYAPYGIFICNEDGKYLDVNEAASLQMGYSKDELLSMSIGDLMAPSALTQGLDHFSKLQKEGFSSSEVLFRKKDGSEFFMSVSATKISDSLFIGFTSDVDKQKKIEQSLIDSESKNRALSQAASEAIIFSIDGYCVECNQATCDLFGYNHDEFVGIYGTEIAADESKELLEKNTLSGYELPYEAVLQRKGGATFIGEIQGQKYSYKGKTVRLTIIRDITAQKQAEKKLEDTFEALKESEEKTRSLSEVANEAIFFTDKGYCVECNQIGCEMFGYTYDEFIGIYGPDIFVPESSKLVQHNMLTGYEKPYEVTALRKDNSTFLVQIYGKMYHYRGKKVRVTIIRDITGQKQAEKFLRETEEKLKLFADNTQDVIWTLDHDLKFVYISPSVFNLQGYTPEEMIGQPLSKFISEDAYNDTLQVFEELIKLPYKEGQKVQAAILEGDLICKNGSLVLVESRANLIFNSNHELQFVTGAIRDITQKKKDEAQLRQASDIFLNMHSGIHLYHLEDINDDRSLRLIAVNPAATAITGLKPEELIGKTIDENFPESRDMNLPQKYAEVVRSQNPAEYESVQYNGLGVGPLILSIKIFPLPNNCMASSFENISKLKQTQEELQIRNSELNNFVYKVSHDLRAPLSSIKGLLYLAKYEKGPDEYLIRIEESIDKLDGFIRNVLSHSRNLNTTPIVDNISFNTLIDQCFSELSYLPEIKRVKKEISISEIFFSNDSVRLFEIFRNMISNAIKYQDFEKDNSFIKVNVSIDDKKAQIVIEDNGIGIEEDHLKKIFDMFYRASEKSDGSGIGLYIVYQAVKKLKGKIRVESKLGVGTKFIIQIPNRSE